MESTPIETVFYWQERSTVTSCHRRRPGNRRCSDEGERLV